MPLPLPGPPRKKTTVTSSEEKRGDVGAIVRWEGEGIGGID